MNSSKSEERVLSKVFIDGKGCEQGCHSDYYDVG